MKDIYGREVQINPGAYAPECGSRPYSIVVSTRRGVRGYEATWHPTNNQARFATKREAAAFVQAHEDVYYSRSGS